MSNLKIIQEQLQDFGETIEPNELFPTFNPKAAEFVLDNPYAFAMAISLDRGVKAEIIWGIPFDLFEQLGHLDPHKINLLTLDELSVAFSKLSNKPRYINAAPRTVKELTTLVVSAFDGDASRIWNDKSAFEVKSLFQSIYGVGPWIANMSVLLIEKAYKMKFSDLDRKNMDIKPDVHTMRVLYRLGISDRESDKEAVEAARKINPVYPGEIDAPLWIIGRKWCYPQNPDCSHCPMVHYCPRIGLS